MQEGNNMGIMTTLKKPTAERGGIPVIAGTHITVEAILRALAAGETVEHVLTMHPELKREAIQAALEFAAEHIHRTAPTGTAEDFANALGNFVPHTPLAKKLWERRKAVIKEALERGEPLLHSWEDVRHYPE